MVPTLRHVTLFTRRHFEFAHPYQPCRSFNQQLLVQAIDIVPCKRWWRFSVLHLVLFLGMFYPCGTYLPGSDVVGSLWIFHSWIGIMVKYDLMLQQVNFFSHVSCWCFKTQQVQRRILHYCSPSFLKKRHSGRSWWFRARQTQQCRLWARNDGCMLRSVLSFHGTSRMYVVYCIEFQ